MNYRSLISFHFLLYIISPSKGHLLQLLSTVKQQDSFNYLLLMKNRNGSFINSGEDYEFIGRLMNQLDTPILQFDEDFSYFLYNKVSNRVLSVVCLSSLELGDHEVLLKSLLATLRLMTTSRVVFLLPTMEVDDVFLYKLFTFCWKMKLLNVLAILKDFEMTQLFYSYSHFPEFQLERRSFNTQEIVFTHRMKNLRGYRVSIIIGGSVPRIIGYYDKQGRAVYKGVVGHFMDVFQQKYNCVFWEALPARADLLLPSTEVIKAVINGSVDISMAISYPWKLNLIGFTYPIEQMNWCLMLPLEADVPPSEYYTRVFELHAFLLTLGTMVTTSMTLATALWRHGYRVDPPDFIMHENCLRGAMGQSFYEVMRAPIVVRAIYVQICLLGFLLTAWYNSYFSAYVTSSPKEPPYRSYDDVLASHLQVVAWEEEFYELIGRLTDFQKYRSMFYVEPDFNKFLTMRDSFDTSYGYMMTTTKWVVMSEQQKVFSQPLFRMRDDFCFFNNVPFGFPVHDNSIYMQPVLDLIRDLTDMGIISHWSKSSFMELVEAGQLHFVDLSARREFRAMQLQDLEYIWYGFGCMAVISSIVFLMELTWHILKRKIKRKI